MLRKLLRQRGVRKLLRDRMAVVAMVVIGVYLLIAGGVLGGMITKEETFERVGVANLPGAWGSLRPEQRLENALYLLETIEGALDSRDPEEALREVRFAERTVAPLDPDELGERLEAAFEVYDELEELSDLDEQPDALPTLARLEEMTDELYVTPGGLEGLKFRARRFLGTDRQGRSISVRAVYSIKVAVQIGVVAALISVLIGTLLGGAAAYFGGWVDHLVVWLYSTFSSIPWIVLLTVLAAMFLGSQWDGTLIPVYAAFCMSFWIGPCRVIRGEVMKLKQLEYVQAATAIGFGRMRILLKHVIPNTAHLMFINFSLLFIGAVKAEVILSFLNLGVKHEPSWGVMISQAKQEVVSGFFWQIGAATGFMVVLVLAFNVLSDALQDAFDPKHVG
jgi:peptide/nickel transport system permease protein